jgi:hypothetical protein
MIELSLRVDDEDAKLFDLKNWIRSDSELRRLRIDTLERPPEPGDMAGGVAEALQMVLQDGGELASIVGAVLAWSAIRKKRVELEFDRGNGRTEVHTVEPDVDESVQFETIVASMSD